MGKLADQKTLEETYRALGLHPLPPEESYGPEQLEQAFIKVECATKPHMKIGDTTSDFARRFGAAQAAYIDLTARSEAYWMKGVQRADKGRPKSIGALVGWGPALAIPAAGGALGGFGNYMYHIWYKNLPETSPDVFSGAGWCVAIGVAAGTAIAALFYLAERRKQSKLSVDDYQGGALELPGLERIVGPNLPR